MADDFKMSEDGGTKVYSKQGEGRGAILHALQKQPVKGPVHGSGSQQLCPTLCLPWSPLSATNLTCGAADYLALLCDCVLPAVPDFRWGAATNAETDDDGEQQLSGTVSCFPALFIRRGSNQQAAAQHGVEMGPRYTIVYPCTLQCCKYLAHASGKEPVLSWL